VISLGTVVPTDAEKFDVRNRAQLVEKVLQLLIVEQQRIAPAKQNVAHRRRAADVINLLVELRMKIVAGGVADQPRPRAIPAVGRDAEPSSG